MARIPSVESFMMRNVSASSALNRSALWTASNPQPKITCQGPKIHQSISIVHLHLRSTATSPQPASTSLSSTFQPPRHDPTEGNLPAQPSSSPSSFEPGPADTTQSMLNCIDNSGAALVECVKVLKMKRAAKVGPSILSLSPPVHPPSSSSSSSSSARAYSQVARQATGS